MSTHICVYFVSKRRAVSSQILTFTASNPHSRFSVGLHSVPMQVPQPLPPFSFRCQKLGMYQLPVGVPYSVRPTGDEVSVYSSCGHQKQLQ